MCRATNQATRQRIIRYIDNYTRRHACCPSIREIGAAVGLSSTSTVHGYIKRLKAEGILTSDPMHPRTIQLSRKHPQEFTWIKTHIVKRQVKGVVR